MTRQRQFILVYNIIRRIPFAKIEWEKLHRDEWIWNPELTDEDLARKAAIEIMKVIGTYTMKT